MILKFNTLHIALFVLLTFFFSCKKEDFTPPAIQTISVVANSPTSFKVVGNISQLGSGKVEDYGFMYNNSPEISETTGIKVSLGKDVRTGEFSKDIVVDNILANSYNNSMWVRTYLKDSRGTVFGALLNVNLPVPSVGNITPNMAMSGDIIKISGDFFDGTVSNTAVVFENVKAKVLSVSKTEISVEVPTGLSARHGNNVNVKISTGTTTINSSSFQILGNYKDFIPKSGPVGTSISFTGDNLPASYYYNSPPLIELGGQQAVIVYNDGGVNVPFTVKENSDLAVTVNGKKKVLGTFTVTAPVISDLSPASVFPGEAVLVKGTNYPNINDYSEGRPRIKLGSGGYQDVYLNDAGQFYYNVPTNIEAGDYPLYLKVGPHEVLSPKKLKILGHTATSFSPKSGSSLQQINITGSFITGSWYNVYFGSVQTNGTATSSTNLQVTVPYGMSEGKVKIMIEFPNNKVTIPGDFEVTGPSFTSFSPTSAVPGTVLTIKGSGFAPNYDTAVKFGSIAVAPNSVTSNTITVTVPSNVSPGAMKLTVVTGGQSVSHKDNFTLLDK